MECTQQEPFLPIVEAAPNLSQNDEHQNEEICISDWLGRPIGDNRAELMGGWKCSSCVLGAFALGSIAYFGIVLNLVVYLVQVCGLTNAEAANTVTNISGTALLCSFVGAYVGDAYMGRLWASLTFQILSLLSYASVSLAVLFISNGPATAMARSYLLVSLYSVAITAGSILPNQTVLGADQLTTIEEKGLYFRLLSISTCVGQLFSVTLVTYIDNREMWAWGFGLCTASYMAAIMLFVAILRYFRQYKASGNPFLRLVQVPVAAWRKRSLSLHDSSSFLLHEDQGRVSSISAVSHKLQLTSALSFLDKAAVLAPTEADNQQYNPWHLCTVTQVEELKCLLRVIPVGIAILLVSATCVQISTLFEEQASLMNRQVTTWLVIPAASLNLFSIGSVILTGIITTTCGATLIRWCSWGSPRVKEVHGKRATSVQLQSAALLCSIIVLVIAALVESHRLRAAQEGTLLSVLWLVPQTVLAGPAAYFATVGGTDFFYSEVPDGTRAVSSSVFLILEGAGSYLSSLLVTLVTAITTGGGKAGWIASDLNQGHVDYFYWLLASCVALTLAIFLVYTHNYAKRTRDCREPYIVGLPTPCQN